MQMDELHKQKEIFVSVIIPAHNEAEMISSTIRAVWQLPYVAEVIVVDDGSTDGTYEVALNSGASLAIKFERNCGKGAALMSGIKASRGNVLLFVDADLAQSAINLKPLILSVINGDADMAIAVPPPANVGGGFGLAKAIARLSIMLSTGLVAMAPLCGQRAVKREVIERIGCLASGFGVEVGLTIDALTNGARVVEIPLSFEHRYTGRTIKGFLHRGRQLVDILRAVLPRLASLKRVRISRGA